MCAAEALTRLPRCYTWVMDRLAQAVDPTDVATEDHVVHLVGATWDDYTRCLEIRGDHSVPRLTYLEGTLELMTPSRDHESLKSMIGRLVEVFCLERDIEFRSLGSWTLGDEGHGRGAEPDECWIFGPEDQDCPHLAIEVIWTSGGLDKLDVYRALGVREVWCWRRGRITAHALRGDRYQVIPTSEVLPEIDLDLLTSFLDRPTTSRAMREFRAALAGES